MLRLDLFTIVRFRINEESPYMPMLFVHNLSRVGTEPLYDSSIKQDRLVCHHSTPTIESSHGDSPPIDPRIDPKPRGYVLYMEFHSSRVYAMQSLWHS